jgi:hypothetical protein
LGPAMYADDTSVLISIKDFDTFCSISNFAYYLVSNWFNADKLFLNLNKTNVIKFLINNSLQYAVPGIGKVVLVLNN